MILCTVDPILMLFSAGLRLVFIKMAKIKTELL
jgi:hypothetical protein